MLRRAALAPALLLIAACSQPDNASGAGGVSAGEARALDDAAQMVQRRWCRSSRSHQVPCPSRKAPLKQSLQLRLPQSPLPNPPVDFADMRLKPV
jgi:hypothetical protein